MRLLLQGEVKRLAVEQRILTYTLEREWHHIVLDNNLGPWHFIKLTIKSQHLIIPEIWKQRRKPAFLTLNQMISLLGTSSSWGFLHFPYCICTILFMSKFPQVAIAVPKCVFYCVREIRRRLYTLENGKAAGVWLSRVLFYIKKTPREPK